MQKSKEFEKSEILFREISKKIIQVIKIMKREKWRIWLKNTNFANFPAKSERNSTKVFLQIDESLLKHWWLSGAKAYK